MAKRLINWRTIKAEKIDRGRSWIYMEMAAGRFPLPAVRGYGANLWDEADVDRWLAQYVELARRKNCRPREAAK